MNKQKPLFLTLSAIVVHFFLFVPTSFGQGELTPPGAPAPTMKTLEEVYDEATAAKSSADTAAANASTAKEPRTPISASDLPLTITSSGSYYLTESITVSTTDTHGITIDCDDVTIDLNGFTLSGPGKNAGTSGSGIYVRFSMDPLITHHTVVIRNGILTNWREDGAAAGDSHNRVESLQSDNNGKNGLSVSSKSIVKNNVCTNNGEYGIITDDHCVIIGNISNENGWSGIKAARYCTVTGNIGNGNTDHGVMVTSAILKGNTFCSNGKCGIFSNYGSLISGNKCFSNSEDGIHASSSCLIVNNVCTSNGQGVNVGAGIQLSGGANCVERNFVVENDRGIDCSSSGGTCILSNKLRGNGVDLYVIPGNTTVTGDRENVVF